MAEEVTGGDLHVLWRTAQVHLPRIADVFYDANRSLGGNAGTTREAFRPNAFAYPGASLMTSSVAGAWEGVRAEMQAMMEQIGTAILDTATGVMNAAQAFEDLDVVNAGTLRAYHSNPSNHSAGAESNPPVAGSAEDPGEPYISEPRIP